MYFVMSKNVTYMFVYVFERINNGEKKNECEIISMAYVNLIHSMDFSKR